MENLPNIPRNELEVLRKHFPQGVIALDVETTGLSPLTDKVIELSAIKITPDEIKVFGELINPGIPIPAHTTAIHGITDQMVERAPTSDKVFPQFFEFAANLPIVAHNAKFDVGFLVFTSHQLGIALLANNVFCSCQLAKKCINGVANHKLSVLAKHLDIDLVNHHRAYDDAVASLRIFARSLLSTHPDKLKAVMDEAFMFKIDDFKQNKIANLRQKNPLTDELIKAVAAQEVIQIKYSGGSVKNQLRPVKPISLLPLPGGDVLYALCLLSNHHKSFALHKIKEVVYPSNSNS